VIKKILVLCVGLACGAGASQGPEFTQQYLQRLGGWVDSYQDRVARLDTRAKQFDMTREQYIAALEASADPKVRKEAANIATWPIYLERYTGMQKMLQDDPSWMQPVRLMQNYNDPAFSPIIQATLAEYQPGAPITTEGAVFGGVGFVGGWILTVIATSLLGAPMNMIRRRQKTSDLPNLVAHKLDNPARTDMAPETDEAAEIDEVPETGEPAENNEAPETGETRET
jgi:hypothetical protein